MNTDRCPFIVQTSSFRRHRSLPLPIACLGESVICAQLSTICDSTLLQRKVSLRQFKITGKYQGSSVGVIIEALDETTARLAATHILPTDTSEIAVHRVVWGEAATRAKELLLSGSLLTLLVAILMLAYGVPRI